MPEFTIPRQSTGLLLSAWLRQHLPEAPAGYLNQLLRGGRLQIAGEAVFADRALTPGETLRLPESQRLRQLLQPPPQILAETLHYLLAGKPAGLPVHATSAGTDNLTEQLQRHLHLLGARYRIAPVHRLDIGTSGPVLFGKGRQALATLGRQFQEGSVLKQYLALVTGNPQAQGSLRDAVRAKGRWRPATTGFRVLRRWPHCSLLLLTLESGRTHQIRQQLAAAGHPLAGDLRYGSRLLPELGRPFLHHCRIGFFDPWQDREVRISAPLPCELRQILATLSG